MFWMAENAEGVEEVKGALLRVLGRPARIQILELVRAGERSVGALQAELGLDSGGTSQHLTALRRIGLVESRREGTSVYCRVDDPQVFELLAARKAIVRPNPPHHRSLSEELEPTYPAPPSSPPLPP